jgi:hypothetical protein
MKSIDVQTAATLTLVMVSLFACASSKPIPARIVKDATALSNCEYMGLASDTDYVDLAKKAGELRGTHAVIVREQPRQRGPLSSGNSTEYLAEVYRCPTVSKR